MVNAGTGLDIAQLQFYLNGQPLVGDTQTLAAAGIKDGELLAMLVRDDMSSGNTGRQSQHRPGPGQQSSSSSARAGAITNEQIETVRLRILGSDQAVQQVSQQHPGMATALQDATRFRELYLSMQQEENTRERERLQQMQLLNEDPFNVEAQAKIEEMIRQDRVMENLEYAYEHNPEGMLASIHPFLAISADYSMLTYIIQSSVTCTCYISIQKSMAATSRPLSIPVLRPPSCPQTAPKHVVSCVSSTSVTPVLPVV
ncbi:hypothetical protein BDV97DRAFT_79663 [Delphinella strobiligena]|nr:hypothetical protein BDV97DRAFT_79663 [Delphinella strobiligena]